jgi:hypothetical protein
MKTSWRTTLFGFIFAAISIAGQYGVKVGRVGNGDWLGLAQAVAMGGLAASARDNKVSSEDAGIK